MASALVAASAPAQATRIFFTRALEIDAFWSVVNNGVNDAAELMSVEVQSQAPQTFDMVAMAQLIDAGRGGPAASRAIGPAVAVSR